MLTENAGDRLHRLTSASSVEPRRRLSPTEKREYHE